MTVILFAEAAFELTTPASVTAPERLERDSSLPQPVALDGWGNPWIPPTSLAGSFRAHLAPAAADLLMGTEADHTDGPDGADGQPPGRPSVVRFLHTEVHLPNTPFVHRTRTAIERHRAAARATTLRTRQYLPPGTRLLCRIRADGAEHHPAILAALRTWNPVIGGERSTGSGVTRSLGIRYTTLDLATPEGRRTWLTQGGPRLFTSTHRLDQAPALASQAPLIRAQFEIVDALHTATGDATASTAAAPGERASAPALLARDHQKRPMVPATTWKGLLRSQCEYILGSLGLPVCVSSDGTCGRCPVCTAFGWSSNGHDDAETVGARALLSFHDTPVTDPVIEIRQHVALDRISGGASDGLLYAEEVAASGSLTLEIHTTADIPPLVTAALHLALHDLHTGRLGVGGGTTRGYGTLRRTDTDDTALQAQRDAAAATLATHLTSAQAPA
jgi:CRISPR/Cas system CSM-associated protein Csm3 (group 7 of RAMP superfamily)